MPDHVLVCVLHCVVCVRCSLMSLIYTSNQEWKAGQKIMAHARPKYEPNADISHVMMPRQPELKLCTMRDKFLADPVRSALAIIWKQFGGPKHLLFSCLFCIVSLYLFRLHIISSDPDWRVRLRNFDAFFQPSSETQSAPVVTTTAVAEKDLGAEAQNVAEEIADLEVPSISEEEFKKKLPTVVCTVTVQMGCTVTVYVVDGAVYVQCAICIKGATSRG